jgi:hypothetical protein
MPIMSGWEFLDALASLDPNFQEKCSIYILTSSLDVTDITKSQSYRMVAGLLHKPITTEDILKITRRITPGSNIYWQPLLLDLGLCRQLLRCFGFIRNLYAFILDYSTWLLLFLLELVYRITYQNYGQ